MATLTIGSRRIEGKQVHAPFKASFADGKTMCGQLTLHYSDRYNARVVVVFQDSQGFPIGSYQKEKTHMRSSFHFDVLLSPAGKVEVANFTADGDAANTWFERLCETAGNFYGIPAAHIRIFLVGSMFTVTSKHSEAFRNFVESAFRDVLLNEEYYIEIRHCAGRIFSNLLRASVHEGELAEVEQYLADYFARNGYTLTKNS